MAAKCKIMNINKILGELSPVPPSFMISVRDCSPDHAVDLVVEVGDGGEGHDAQHHEPEQHHGYHGYIVSMCWWQIRGKNRFEDTQPVTPSRAYFKF